MQALRCAAWVCALASACGTSTSTPDAGGVDAAMDVVESEPSPMEAGPACDVTKPFGAPVPLAELNTPANDLFPRLTHDELTVYFERYASSDAGVMGGNGAADLFVATRASTSVPFGTPTAMTNLDIANTFDPSPTGDDLTLYFASNRAGSVGGVDIWTASRTNTTSAFGSVMNVAALNTTANEHTPYVMPDNLTIYYTGTGGSSLLRATRASTSTPFAVDTSGTLDAVNTGADEVGPAVTVDELTLYFATDRGSSTQTLSIWKATRASTGAPFESMAAVTELQTTGNAVPGWISDDGCRLYLYEDTSGSDDLYSATKPN